jgi:hypothetical protein
MAELPAKLKIFIGSPGDVAEERDIVSLVVSELRRVFENILPVQLEPVRWETHAWPDVGQDAQDVINREIGKYDIFVGIMWKRFGTQTKRGRSGTDEEFQRAYSYFKKYGRPKIMFYFRKTPFYTTDGKELGQFQKVVRFRKELEKLGVLFWEYDKPLEFERSVREHLIRQIYPMCHPAVPPSAPPSGLSRPSSSRAARLVHKLDYMMKKGPRVFLVYSHADREVVTSLHDNLRVAGFYPWLDTEKILPGQMWQKVVRDAISETDAVILCLSLNAMTSKPSSFQSELDIVTNLARSRGKSGPVIIPLRLDPVPLPVGIGSVQFLDLFLPDGFERLVQVLKEHTKGMPNKAL